jgi:hypothetical protein
VWFIALALAFLFTTPCATGALAAEHFGPQTRALVACFVEGGSIDFVFLKVVRDFFLCQ